MKMLRIVLMCVVVASMGIAGISVAESPKGQMPGKSLQTKPGSQAFKTIEGKLKAIDGEFYVVEGLAGKTHRLHVSKDTLMVNGAKKPGDAVRADITKSGHAISIQ